uniref:SEC7 domain-containing protein n=1 Tax=Schizophyllum commune (strain H4-8 / FGSC 9210) TaxID=578458 RepID=D8PRN3_SCHCM
MAAVDVAANVPLPTSPPLGQSVTTASLDGHISNSASEEPVSTPAAEPTENRTDEDTVHAEAPAQDATPATTEPVVSTDSEAAPAMGPEPAEATHDATEQSSAPTEQMSAPQMEPSVSQSTSTESATTPVLPPTTGHRRSLTLSKGNTVSVVLISTALETIAASKEAKRSAPLKESVQKALDLVKSNQGGDRPREIFEPLRLACETRSEKLMIASLDCISKLISYSFFEETVTPTAYTSPPGTPTTANGSARSDAPPLPLVDLVVNTITQCHNESTPESVSLQIVKALLALVLSQTILVHHSSLLKAVRTVYNIFLLSNDPVNQTVAQGGLTQMVNHLTTHDLFIKDAFLVFRALCKLTMKPLNTESERDLKSHAMRSKLLSLHLVLSILNSHMPLLVDPSAIIYSSSSHDATTFVQAINQYLCLSLSRNAVSPVLQVFELSVEIFWRVLSGMRTKLKKEIEVLFREIFMPILEMKTSTLKQKAIILGMFSRLCQDPQALVEIYLNYDCDRESADNIYEHLMNIISKIGSTSAPKEPGKGNEPPPSPGMPPQKGSQGNVPPALSTQAMSIAGSMDTSNMGHSEAQLKRQGLECLVTVLRSLVAWGTTAPKSTVESAASASASRAHLNNDDVRRDSMTPDNSVDRMSTATAGSSETLRQPTPDFTDDPSKFETAKQRKTTLLEGIKKFNFKPKRGIQFLIENGFIPSNSPQDIAAFLLHTDGLSKAMIGEYLGEGDEANVTIMHAFVDMMDFRGLGFVDALRTFLQSFRLPGEAQKIDRYMLKFADKYMANNEKTPFINANAAYVFAYSVILLNTDAHNPQVKKRMTKADFIKNNRGINADEDSPADHDPNLPEDFLTTVYDEIVSNEIRMKDEVEAVGPAATPGGIAGALANVGRDLQKEAYVMQSSGMASKTEALFKTMMRTQRRASKAAEQFFSATQFVHVRPMFEVAWIPFLAGLSGPLQETDDIEIVELCLDGFKSAIHIACFFDMELQRNAFVTTLAKFTFLNNLGEMKAKNMEAIKTLLDIALHEGNHLKGSWHEVLTCVSQLEHMQLLSSGVDLPEGQKGRSKKLPAEALANESRSTHITVASDMVFSLSHYLSGTAIVDFVQALCDVSWEEIQGSGLSQNPRLFSLQKLVEISYYNMNRIRVEWTNIWAILGEHFNQVCCHNNPHVGFFALDALRQLAMRFLEKEELPQFKFQKDFLKPFEYTMVHNQNPEIRDLVLVCLQQMIQARVENMRSGWRTMFHVFSAASRVLTERIVNSAFEIVTRLNKEHFGAIVRHGAFADLTNCITQFCKVSKFQKISLLAIAMLRDVITVMLESPECAVTAEGPAESQPSDHFWHPVLFGFYDIIMTGEDLEVRRLALDSMFSTLKTYGAGFPLEYWDAICSELLFPIFSVLKSSQDLSRFSTQEDMSVWLSTTMIQALRNLIDLYTYYFEILERSLDGLLDLLCVCICQENDTLSRIGTSCLQQLLENNVKKLSPARWERVVTTFIKLFKTTTPHQLFDESLRIEIDGLGNGTESPDAGSENSGQTILPAPLSPTTERPRSDPRVTLADRRRIFKQIIVKCVLQLLLIETTSDLLRNDEVYSTIPPEHLLRLMGVLDQSYRFARDFNEDKELRTGLWKVGFMRHLPNLLKQESSSAATLIHILTQMYFDPRPEHRKARPQISERLLPLGLGVIEDFNKLRQESQAKNILAWTPVVSEILDCFSRLDDKSFKMYLPAIYPLATHLLDRDLAPEIRAGLKAYYLRVGFAQGIIDSS